MDVTCERCGKPMPDFARVCEHCGNQVAEQLALPAFAVPTETEPKSEASENFDFAHDSRPEVTEIESVDKLPSTRSEGWQDDIAEVLVAPVMTASGTEASEIAPFDPPQAAAQTETTAVPHADSAVAVFGSSSSSVEASAATAKPRSRKREIVMVTIAATISGVLTLGLLLMRAAPVSETVTATAVVSSTVERAAPISPDAVTTWSAANSAMWAGPQKNSIAFEVEAENTVSVWMRTVRPALVVRCTAGAIEAFVFTASAAQIEPKTEDHTVQFGFDGGSMVTEHWRDSEEHDALFAPDGTVFVQQLLNANAFRFGFTPHNAAPVTARFSVGGLRELLSSSRKQCGKS
jgi:hypothetical protein